MSIKTGSSLTRQLASTITASDNLLAYYANSYLSSHSILESPLGPPLIVRLHYLTRSSNVDIYQPRTSITTSPQLSNLEILENILDNAVSVQTGITFCSTINALQTDKHYATTGSLKSLLSKPPISFITLYPLKSVAGMAKNISSFYTLRIVT